jgi:hypothetical protein
MINLKLDYQQDVGYVFQFNFVEGSVLLQSRGLQTAG